MSVELRGTSYVVRWREQGKARSRSVHSLAAAILLDREQRVRPLRPFPLSFWDRVEPQHDGCWLWTGAYEGLDGYGGVWVPSLGKVVKTHRVAWELAHGPIPDGAHVDHLCRVKRCVNPEHLEPVTPSVNAQRAVPYRKPRARSQRVLDREDWQRAWKVYRAAGFPGPTFSVWREANGV